MQKRVVCSTVCLLLFLGLTIFTLVGLNPLIDSVILDGVVLAPETYDLWGANPGSSEIATVRNFTFFNFTNPHGFLYRGQLPIFTQISNFVYQERSNFTQVRYSSDRSVIDFNYWLYFTVMESSRNVNEKVSVLNMAPLGFWAQLDQVDDSTFALQGFGGLFVEMNNTIKLQAVGQGVKGQYLQTEKDWNIYCEKMQIESEMCGWLWKDAFYGLGDENHYQPWVRWLYKGEKSSGIAIVGYFGLDQWTIYQFSKLFPVWCQAIEHILDDWYCSGEVCKQYDLTLSQLSRGGLTADPPTGDPMDSICLGGNITCQGFPELFSFYKHVFLNKTRESSYYNLTFSRSTIQNLFSPYNGTLLNIGNLSELFEYGRLFDKNRHNITLIDKLIAITHGESKFHAVVIWEYAKYFTDEFVLKKSKGGQRKMAGLAGVFSQALYESVTSFGQWALREMLSLTIAEKMGNCTKFILNSSESIPSNTARKMCENVTSLFYQNYLSLVEPCSNPLLKPELKSMFGLSSYSIFQLCDAYQSSFSTLFSASHETLYNRYNCSANSYRKQCTAFELGAKQFLNSAVTLNPLKSSIRQYPSSLTSHTWNKQMEEFEYRHYLQIAYNDAWVDKQKFDDYDRVASILSFDKFYSVPGVQDLLLEKNSKNFQEKYYWNNATLLLGYIRFLTIEVGFGGLTQERTVNELLLGYQDPFLKQLKEMDPMLGGDPSIETIVMLNEPNATLEEAAQTPQSMLTGYSDASLVRNYISNKGFEYVTYNKTYYTGYQVVSQQVNPFKAPQKLFGTDAVQNLPMSTPESKQYIYLDTLYRVVEMEYNRSDQKFGFDVLVYKVSKNTIASEQQYPPNQNFYQKERGMFNLSFLGAPALVSKNHFLGCDEKWGQRVKFLDESGQFQQFANEYDDSVLILEPKTGATFSATVFLQNNIHMQPDILFSQREPVMLPVVSVYRSANLTEAKANELLGDLKTALAAPRKMILFSVVGLLLVIAMKCCCLVTGRKESKAESLLESGSIGSGSRIEVTIEDADAEIV